MNHTSKSVRDARREHGITQQQLAEAAGADVAAPGELVAELEQRAVRLEDEQVAAAAHAMA
jgi:hypothetical protein